MPRLIVYRDGEPPRVLELSGSRPLSIGRAKSSSLMLDDPSISRLHAIVLLSPDGRWQIVDRGSTNGLKVNGRPMKETTLRPNDELALGVYRMRFEEPDVQGLLAQQTVQVPREVIREMGRSMYSDGFLPVTPIAEDIRSDAGPQTMGSDRVRLLERENKILALLLNVNRTLGDLESVPEIVNGLLNLVLKIQGAERSYCMLLDESVMGQGDFAKGGYVFQPAVLRQRQSRAASAKQSDHLIISQTIISNVIKTGSPVLLADAQSDPSLAASQSVVRSGIRSAMCAPLGTRERRFGLLYVDNASRPGMFTPEDLNVFAVIAMQAGLRIDHIRSRNEIAEIKSSAR